LYNRRFLNETLEQHVVHARRNERTIGVIMLDIDYFKRFNDTYGHDGGDAVLCALAEYLRSHTRRSDITCRFGGEEFVIIMPETSLDATHRRAQELTHGVRSLRVTMDGYELAPVTVSMGVAAFPLHGDTPASLITSADSALYRAKMTGRDRVCVAGE
jgi:diguanylate cyclase (GGDEF)-like protein